MSVCCVWCSQVQHQYYPGTVLEETVAIENNALLLFYERRETLDRPDSVSDGALAISTALRRGESLCLVVDRPGAFLLRS